MGVRPALPRRLALGAAVLLLATLAGLGARGTAPYLSSHPEACLACHRMEAPYRAWKVGHHAKVPCQACHVPQGAATGLAHKVTAGLRHGTLTLLDRNPPPLRLDAHGLAVVETNCRRCHPASGIPVAPGSPNGRPGDAYHAQASRDCLSCHGSPHAFAHGL